MPAQASTLRGAELGCRDRSDRPRRASQKDAHIGPQQLGRYRRLSQNGSSMYTTCQGPSTRKK